LQTRWDDLTFKFCATGVYGQYFSRFLHKQSRPFSFIDIGSNIGLYSLIAARNRNCARAYAFEPNPEVFASLTHNARVNGLADKVTAINAAVSSSVGLMKFSTSKNHTGGGRISDAGTLLVRVEDAAALDAIASENAFSKIVKVDVEGHEPVVIAELIKSRIWFQITHLYFEASERFYDVEAVVKLLKSNGLHQEFKNGSGEQYDLMFTRIGRP
jgi:FkbM family methyltransferase